MMHDMWGWGMWMGWIFWLVIIGLIIWGVKTTAGQNRSQSGNRPPEESAMDILKKRYARGEINAYEFEEKKRRLA